jgi:N-acetylglucosamine kinase-like BadF-type ATPase
MIALGLDAGGTATRWALCADGEAIVRSGEVAPLSALDIAREPVRAQWRSTLATLAQALVDAPPAVIHAGLTGLDGDTGAVVELLRSAFSVAPERISICGDVELACHAAFAPGAGYLVYAGTGSMAAYVDAHGVFHRAGGRGFILDDAGSGYWIAREALRLVWRREDESPGAWRGSPMARELFSRLGGADWSLSRRQIYQGTRGELGQLAIAVAAVAEQDAAARQILIAAGGELARLGNALRERFGARPVALAGRVFDLHPLIAAACRAALTPGTVAVRGTAVAAHAAARLAWRRGNGLV